MRREPPRIGPQERLLLLKRLPIAEGLPAEGFVPLAQHAVERRFAAGATVVPAGALLPALFLVAEGRLLIERDDRPAASIGRGDVTGALEVMAHAPSAATIRAAADTLLLEIPADMLFDVYEDHFGIFMATVRNVAEALLNATTADRTRNGRPGANRRRHPISMTWCSACSGSGRIRSSSGAGSDRWFDSRRNWRPSWRRRERGCGRGATAPHGFCFSSEGRLPARSRARSISSKAPDSTSARWNRSHNANGGSTPTSAKRLSAFDSALSGLPTCSRTTSRWRKTFSPSSRVTSARRGPGHPDRLVARTRVDTIDEEGLVPGIPCAYCVATGRRHGRRDPGHRRPRRPLAR